MFYSTLQKKGKANYFINYTYIFLNNTLSFIQ